MTRSGPKPGNTLLEAPSLGADADAGVYKALSQSPPAETNLLVISYRQGPDAWLSDWQTHMDALPAELGFVHVGGITRSAAASQSSSPIEVPFGFIDTIGDPADLTGLGIQVSAYLERWTDTENQIVVYLDSLTALLQFVDLQRAFRFLHVLGGRIESVDGHAYYRLDPDAHETQTIATLQSLMDATVAVGEPE